MLRLLQHTSHDSAHKSDLKAVCDPKCKAQHGAVDFIALHQSSVAALIVDKFAGPVQGTGFRIFFLTHSGHLAYLLQERLESLPTPPVVFWWLPPTLWNTLATGLWFSHFAQRSQAVKTVLMG